MSLKSQIISEIPRETREVAQACFPKGNIYMKMRDDIGVLFSDTMFMSLFPPKGQPAKSPCFLAMVTLMQYIERLSDRQAADSVRSRIDWKYALGLKLTDCGFDYSVLSEFRTRLVKNNQEQKIFDTLLNKCRELGFLKARGKQRTDSTHVLGQIRAMTRLECVGETMRYALNTLAVAVPTWLKSNSELDWIGRYSPRAEDYRLPKEKSKRDEYAKIIGKDGCLLLDRIDRSKDFLWLNKIEAVKRLRLIWSQQYDKVGNDVIWKTGANIPASSELLSSPYDKDVRYAKKRSTSWIGYKVHITETCDENMPNLITNIATTKAPISDDDTTISIHQGLKEKEILPKIHIVDTGYIDAQLLVDSEEKYQISLLGPTRLDYKWQAQANNGFDAAKFIIDWENKEAICPMGSVSKSWTTAVDGKHKDIDVVKIKFSKKDCGSCLKQLDCTKSNRRAISIRNQKSYLALQAARSRESTENYKEEYKKRAGIEGTISQGIRKFGLRRAKYIGIAKTHLQHLMIATAINFNRLVNWLLDYSPTKTRKSSFAILMDNN